MSKGRAMTKTQSDSIRVVVVDDSPTARELLVMLLQRVEGIQVVGTASNGEDAIRLTKRLRPDIVTMDVFMPQMDGLEATRRIMRQAPTPIVVVTSTLMRNDMDLTFESLKSGALTAVLKPGLADPETCDQVVQAVRLMADVPVVRRWGRGEGASEDIKAAPAPPAPRQTERKPTKASRRSVKIVGIASSTGGPGALATVLGSLPADYPLPIAIVQHVAAGFTTGLVEWLDSETPLRVSVAAFGDTLKAGSVSIAPDDYHMQVNGRGGVKLSKEPPYKGLRPSANYLFDSLAHNYGPQALGVVLTGMGDDGADGMETLHQAGALTVAQDEKSCVVYGMPREAVIRKAIDLVLPLDQIAALLGHQA